MEFLQVQEIFKDQNGSPILHPISFSVRQGKKIGIAGATGSGKSTLLKTIAGLAQPDGGNVYLGEKRVLGPDEKLLPGHPSIGFLSQHFELRNNYTIGEELEYANLLPPAEAAAIYELCDIAHLLSRGTNQVSGGEKQRVVTARVLTTNPKLLLLDEPFSNLDLEHRRVMKGIIRHVVERMGITCMMVAHDPVDMLPWADEILVLQSGRLVQSGTPDSIYYHPVDEYVAALFGPYNLISIEQAAQLGIKADGHGGQVLVRPGDVLLDTVAGSTAGTIVERNFLGSHFELKVALIGFEITVSTLNPGLEIGEKVYVKALARKRGWIK